MYFSDLDTVLVLGKHFLISTLILFIGFSTISNLFRAINSDLIEKTNLKRFIIMLLVVTSVIIVFFSNVKYLTNIIDNVYIRICFTVLEILLLSGLWKFLSFQLFKREMVKNNVITVYFYIPVSLIISFLFNLLFFINSEFADSRIYYISQLARNEHLMYRRSDTWVNFINFLIKLNIVAVNPRNKELLNSTELYNDLKINKNETIGRAINVDDLDQKVKWYFEVTNKK